MIRVIAQTDEEREVVLLALQDGSLSTALGGYAVTGWHGRVKVGSRPAGVPFPPRGRHQRHPRHEPEPEQEERELAPYDAALARSGGTRREKIMALYCQAAAPRLGFSPRLLWAGAVAAGLSLRDLADMIDHRDRPALTALQDMAREVPCGG